MKCPACQNGYHEGFACPGFRLVRVPCDICKGTQELPENLIYDKERGEKMRQDRISRRVIMRKECKNLGVNVCTLSMMERGFFER